MTLARRIAPADIAALVLVAALALFAAGPIIALVWRGVVDHEAMVTELSSAAMHASLFATLRTSAWSTVVALILGAPLAFVFVRTDMPFRRGFELLFTSLVALPPFILGLGWIALANPSSGFLNRIVGAHVFDIYGTGGIALVQGTSGVPLVVFATQAALERIDGSLEEAARLSGAGPLRAIADATLPLALPAIVSGALLVFLSSAASFGVPYMLGAATTQPVHVLTTRIYTQVLMGGESAVARACVLAGVLLVLATLTLGASTLVGRSGRVRLLQGKGAHPNRIVLGKHKLWVTSLVAVLAFVTVMLPLIAIVITSLLANASLPVAFESFTVSHWGEIIGSHRTLSAAGRSVALAGVSATAVCILGLAIGLTRHRWTGRAAEVFALWPYAIPGTVLAMGLIISYSLDTRIVIADSFALVLTLANGVTMLIVAYVAKYVAIGSRNVIEGVVQLDPTLAEAARLCGAGPIRAFIDVVLPRLASPLFAAFVLTFLLCVTELTMSVLLVPPGHETLGTLLFDLQSYADPASASVLACAVVLVVGAGLAVSALTRRSA